jgi:hypothetical protein
MKKKTWSSGGQLRTNKKSNAWDWCGFRSSEQFSFEAYKKLVFVVYSIAMAAAIVGERWMGGEKEETSTNSLQ